MENGEAMGNKDGVRRMRYDGYPGLSDRVHWEIRVPHESYGAIVRALTAYCAEQDRLTALGVNLTQELGRPVLEALTSTEKPEAI